MKLDVLIPLEAEPSKLYRVTERGTNQLASIEVTWKISLQIWVQQSWVFIFAISLTHKKLLRSHVSFSNTVRMPTGSTPSMQSKPGVIVTSKYTPIILYNFVRVSSVIQAAASFAGHLQIPSRRRSRSNTQVW